MRISDWSSDVCSSDLTANAQDMAAGEASGLTSAMLDRLRLDETRLGAIAAAVDAVAALPDPVGAEIDRVERPNGRSEERRVGKERVSTCRCRWSRYL